jgi:neurotransmitter:Na+ symporter, NSS family
VLAAACSLSLGPLSDHRLFGRTLFDLLDGVTGNFFLPLGGLLMSVFIGCRADRALLEAQLTSRGTVPFRFFKGYVLIMKYVAPIVILLIFLEQLGLVAG